MKSIVFYILSIVIVSIAVYQRITYGLADNVIIIASIPATLYLISETHRLIPKRRFK